YQERVARELLSGRNVVLVAPTGSGKTLAAVHPFVYARQQGRRWADRLLYALPLRTLAGALYSDPELRAGLERAGLGVTTQTGLNRGDPLFRGDVCFATIDQVLSAYVGEPVSTSARQANIVGGALVGAYVVFDEFHLLEKEKALATALDLAERLRRFASILVMTATAPQEVVTYLRERLDAAVVEPSATELAEMPAQSSKKRRYEWRPTPLTPEAVVQAHLASRRKRTMAVFNTVDRAQAAYRQVREALPDRHNVVLLHSRFLPRDRQAKEELVLRLLGEDSAEETVLVATQVVEVGLNVSCETLLTELAPASSIVQRAGRCARFPGEEGVVLIHDVPDDGPGRFAPYREDECESTRRVLVEQLGGGAVESDYMWERELVDKALGQIDREALAALPTTERSREVAHALSSEPAAAYRRFVRDVDATSLTIHRTPETLDLTRGLEVFSVSDGVLRAFLRCLRFDGPHAGTVFYPEWDDTPGDEEGPPVREWVPLRTPADIRTAMTKLLLVVSPDVAAYDAETGLRLGEPGDWQAGQGDAPAAGVRRGGEADDGAAEQRGPESFRRHALDVGRRVRDLVLSEASAGLERVAAAFGVPLGDLVDLLELAARLHDLGKLDRRWQKAIWEVEETVAGTARPPRYPERREEAFLAHSTANPAGTGGRPPGVRKRLPAHAVARACAGYQVLKALARERLGKCSPRTRGTVLGALVAAVARHHHPLAGDFTGFELDQGALEEVEAAATGLVGDAARACPKAVTPEQGRSLLRGVFGGTVRPSNPEAWCLYWLAVRATRLADQESQRGEVTR
ncbi:MAG TPA: CRISPR-associated helicase Cas3', partial [Clostridiales bacterium]|nr:CRISPR-associated helicase Cas3' [Clostridiales bacterium]